MGKPKQFADLSKSLMYSVHVHTEHVHHMYSTLYVKVFYLQVEAYLAGINYMYMYILSARMAAKLKLSGETTPSV